MADVAVVLVGQLRRFEASGPTLLRWLLAPPPHSADPLRPPGRTHSSRRSLVSNAAKTTDVGATGSSSTGQTPESADRSRSSSDRGAEGTPQGTPEGVPQGPAGGRKTAQKGRQRPWA